MNLPKIDVAVPGAVYADYLDPNCSTMELELGLPPTTSRKRGRGWQFHYAGVPINRAEALADYLHDRAEVLLGQLDQDEGAHAHRRAIEVATAIREAIVRARVVVERAERAVASAEPAGERAAFYDVLVVGPGTTWTDVAQFVDRDDAIAEARRLLDEAGARYAAVQGRGTPAHPTPAGEVSVYRGVAAGYVAPPTWIVGTFERRPARERTTRRSRARA